LRGPSELLNGFVVKRIDGSNRAHIAEQSYQPRESATFLTGTALERIGKSSQRGKSTGFDWAFDLGCRNSKISHALLESKHGEFASFGKDFIVLLVWFLRISAR